MIKYFPKMYQFLNNMLRAKVNFIKHSKTHKDSNQSG